MKKLILTLSLILPLLYLSSCKTAQTASKQTSTDEQAMLKALAWQEANPIQAKAPTDWTNGAYYTGVMKAHQSTQNPIFLKALVDMGNRNQWKTYDRLYHADDVAISNAYLYLKEIGNNEVQLGPTDAFIQAHLFEPQDWKVGKGNAEQVILWWWCDALFMAPPVLTKYSNLKKDEKYLDEMHKYYAETKKLLYDDEEKLFFRDNRFLWKGQATDRKENNGRKIFWSRGNGWVLGGLAMILEDMPKNYKHRDFYVDLYKTMSKRILELQHPDGLWRTSLLAPENFSHGEVSGSGFFTYALAWGINNGHLDAKTYKPAVQKAWAALKDCQQETGKVGWVQNIGFDPKPADKDSWQNFGTGAFLLAGSEMLKLK